MMSPDRPLGKEDASLLLEQWRREMEAAERQQHRMQLVMQSAAGVCVLITAAHAAAPFAFLENLSHLMVGVSAVAWAAGFVMAVWYLGKTPALPSIGNARQELRAVWDHYQMETSGELDWTIMLEGVAGDGGALQSLDRYLNSTAADNNRFRGWLWGIIGISGICWTTVTICELAAWTV